MFQQGAILLERKCTYIKLLLNEKKKSLTYPRPTRTVPATIDWGDFKGLRILRDDPVVVTPIFTAGALTILLLQGNGVQ